jgi:hypothetical protein
MALSNRDKAILRVFEKNHTKGSTVVPFSLEDLREAVEKVGYREKNIADLRYQYVSGRSPLPDPIKKLGFKAIVGRGKGRYAFVHLIRDPEVDVPEDLAIIPIPDATPEIVLEYAGADEQGLLAKLLYNRLIDCFLGITCYHLQNHLRTSLEEHGQIEVDALYVGLDKTGRQYIIPVEAKGPKGRISRAQLAGNIAFACKNYPRLILRPVGAKAAADGSIFLYEFVPAQCLDDISVVEVKRYRLVPMDEVPLPDIESSD